MKRRITEIAKVSEEATNKFTDTEEQIGAIKLSFSRFNHEFKLLEASHEDLRVSHAACGLCPVSQCLFRSIPTMVIDC